MTATDVRDREREEQARAHRRARYDLLDAWRGHSVLERVRKCGIVPRTSDGVGFRYGGDRAGWSGLCQCGSVWACPVHAAKIGAERAGDIASVIRYTIGRGGTVVFITLTARHHGGMSLEQTLDGVTKAWSFVGRHRWWKKRLDEQWGRLGFCRALEVTWGRKNGWHPHLHVLLFLEKPATEDVGGRIEVLRLGDELRTVYAAGLAKSGMDCSVEHGVDVRIATDDHAAEDVLAVYLTKMASEVTRGDRKHAGFGRFTAFELMAKVTAMAETDPERAQLVARLHEYERTMTGRRQLTWSGTRTRDEEVIPDIRTLAGLREERSDEEIAEADDIASGDLFFLRPAEWRKVVPHRLTLQEVAETEGVKAVLDMLDASGVLWELPHERAQVFGRELVFDAVDG